MKVFLENDFSQPVVVGMNNEFLEIFDKLPLETDYKKFFSDGLEDKKTSLRLLDGKYIFQKRENWKRLTEKDKNRPFLRYCKKIGMELKKTKVA